MLRRILLSSTLFFSLQLQAADKDKNDIGFSLDLNPIVLGCIKSDGACLGNTGVQIIDSFFNNNLKVDLSGYNTYENWRATWMKSGGVVEEECRTFKEEYYIKKFGWGCDPNWLDQRCKDERTRFLSMAGPEGPYTHTNFVYTEGFDYDCSDEQLMMVLRIKMLKNFGYLKFEDQPGVVCKNGVCRKKG